MRPLTATVTWIAALAAIVGTAQWAIAQAVTALPDTQDPAAVDFFEKKVRPLLIARCHECHGGEKHKGNLRLDSRAAALAGGDTGVAIVPGKPDESLLVDAIRYGDTYQMPPKSQLPPDDVATLVEWVRSAHRGAPTLRPPATRSPRRIRSIWLPAPSTGAGSRSQIRSRLR